MDIKPAKREYLDKTSHTVRASQAVLQYGVGAMVDFPTQTLIMRSRPQPLNSTPAVKRCKNS